MKLYTEEQVNKIAIQVKDYGYWNHLEITHIELPSDEEMEKYAKQFDSLTMYLGVKIGVKLIMDKIQGGKQ